MKKQEVVVIEECHRFSNPERGFIERDTRLDEVRNPQKVGNRREHCLSGEIVVVHDALKIAACAIQIGEDDPD